MNGIAQVPGKVVNEGGIAIFRDEEISDNQYVRAMNFKGYVDRRAENNINAGYILFFNDEAKKHVSSQNVIDIFLDEEMQPQNLENDYELKKYILLKSKVSSHLNINNIIKPLLEKICALIDANIEKYNDNVLRSGKWFSRKELKDEQDKEEEKESIFQKTMKIRHRLESTKNLYSEPEIDRDIKDLKQQKIKFQSNEHVLSEAVDSLTKFKDTIYQNIKENILNEEKKKADLEKEKKARMEYEKLQELIRIKQVEEETKKIEKQRAIESLGL